VDGAATIAKFTNVIRGALDAAGNYYVADVGNHSIRKITPAGFVTTIAGNGTAGFVNGLGPTAQLNSPSGVTVDAAGNVYVADNRNHAIRKLTPEP
jgi:DNA-binding beta-propeller fold protein YncE